MTHIRPSHVKVACPDCGAMRNQRSVRCRPCYIKHLVGQKRTLHCSECEQAGHNRVTCPERRRRSVA